MSHLIIDLNGVHQSDVDDLFTIANNGCWDFTQIDDAYLPVSITKSENDIIWQALETALKNDKSLDEEKLRGLLQRFGNLDKKFPQ